MSLNIEGSSCARCKAYLFSEDDIVYCPVCGAPHHRECYSALGHCALEELHGTEQEYSRVKELENKQKLSEKAEESNKISQENETVSCRMCGNKYPRENNACPQCNAPNIYHIHGFEGFDFLGGIPKDFKIDDNVTADEAKRFVIANTHRYIPKFASLNKSNKISWNWFAFLFPSGWMLSRKMFKNGIITAVLSITTKLMTIPLNITLDRLGILTNTSYAELISGLTKALPEISTAVILLSALGGILDLLIRIFSAVFGDYIYKNHTVSQIIKIKKESKDIEYSFRKKGGVNILFFFLSYLALQYIPIILLSLF